MSTWCGFFVGSELICRIALVLFCLGTNRMRQRATARKAGQKRSSLVAEAAAPAAADDRLVVVEQLLVVSFRQRCLPGLQHLELCPWFFRMTVESSRKKQMWPRINRIFFERKSEAARAIEKETTTPAEVRKAGIVLQRDFHNRWSEDCVPNWGESKWTKNSFIEIPSFLHKNNAFLSFLLFSRR